jgi:hypothetical protein
VRLSAAVAVVHLAAVAPDPGAHWSPLLAFDEVRVEVDAAHVGGAGPVSAWLRYTLADRRVTPTAWDRGARVTVDAVEVDCASGATRTLESAAYAADGSAVPAASYADAAAPWRRPTAASLGGRVAAAVCRLAGAR